MVKPIPEGLHSITPNLAVDGAADPFDVPGAGISFASEPAVADLDNDGRAELLLTSWTEKGSGQSGQLLVLDSEGRLLISRFPQFTLFNAYVPSGTTGSTHRSATASWPR